MSQVARLWGAPAGTPKAGALEVLMTLIDARETKHHAIESPNPIEAILFRMEQQGLTRNDLIPMIGSRGRVSEVLNRKRVGPLLVGTPTVRETGARPPSDPPGGAARINAKNRRRGDLEKGVHINLETLCRHYT